jgi:hypothetical protein
VHNVFGLANQQVAPPPVGHADKSISFLNLDELLGLCSDQDLQDSIFGGEATIDPQTQPAKLEFALLPHCARPIPPTNKLHDALHTPKTRLPLHLTQVHLDALEVCERVFKPSLPPSTSGYSSARTPISSDDSSHQHSVTTTPTTSQTTSPTSNRTPSSESSSQHSANSSSAERHNIKTELTDTEIQFRTPDGSAWSEVVLAMGAKEIEKVSKLSNLVNLTKDQLAELKHSARKYKQRLAQRKFALKRKLKLKPQPKPAVTDLQMMRPDI